MRDGTPFFAKNTWVDLKREPFLVDDEQLQKALKNKKAILHGSLPQQCTRLHSASCKKQKTLLTVCRKDYSVEDCHTNPENILKILLLRLCARRTSKITAFLLGFFVLPPMPVPREDSPEQWRLTTKVFCRVFPSLHSIERIHAGKNPVRCMGGLACVPFFKKPFGNQGEVSKVNAATVGKLPSDLAFGEG